jgi:serine/threonine protein kinase
MGVVYRAEDTRLGRDVALKFIAADRLPDNDARRRFDREARAASALNHPNICTVYDIGYDGDVPFLVLELLKGRSLKEHLATGPLPPAEILDIAMAITDALEAAHDAGIIHRDLKPANVFVTDRGIPKLLDFGLAKVSGTPLNAEASTSTASHLTSAHTVVGTLPYMSPEQVRGQPLDARTDLFSFGAVLYEMATGRPPFGGDTSGLILENVLARTPIALSRLNANCPPALEGLIEKAIEKDRELRYQSARDLRIDLKRLKASSGNRALPVEGSSPRLAAGNRWHLAAIVAGLVVLVAAAAWLGGRTFLPGGGRPSAPGGAPRVSPFLTSPALERQPAWSPNASLIAYVSDESGNDDIWICDSSGTSATNLTSPSAGVDVLPAWSPDGSHIAFYSERDGPGVYAMTALGATVRKLVALHAPYVTSLNVDAYSSVQWPLDDRVIYDDLGASGRRQVYSAAVDGSPPVCLTCELPDVADARGGRLSPDGRWLAFLGGATPSPLYLLELQSRRLTQLAKSIENPQWSGRDRIMFTSKADGIEDLWEVSFNLATGTSLGAPVRVTSGLGVRWYSVTDGGRRILATRDTTSSHLWTLPVRSTPLADLSEARRLTSGEARDSQGRWAPDGSVVFISTRRGGYDVWRLPPGEKTPVQLTNTGNAEYPIIAPSGRWIGFDEYSGGMLFAMRPDGGASHIIDETWPRRFRFVCCADWSPSGARLAILAGDGSLRTPFIVDVDPATGRARGSQITTFPGLPASSSSGRWSPDGRWLVFHVVAVGINSLWIAASDGRGARKLIDLPGHNDSVVWQARPLSIYFRHDFTAIWRLSMRPDGTPAGPPEPWLQLPLRQSFDEGSFDFSPQGDDLLVTIIQHATDLWLVERSS